VRNSELRPVFDSKMKADFPNDDDLREAGLDENDPVWRLLAESPRPEPDAWFAVRTLARCRYAMAGAESHGISFGRIWRWTLGGGLGLCLAVLLVTQQIPATSPTDLKQQKVQAAFEVMANLDSPETDSTSSSTSTWQDSSD